MHTVFLDAAGRVVAAEREREGHTTMTLAQAQAVVPECAERIAGGPDGLALYHATAVRYHTRTTGDGTGPAHYTPTVVPPRPAFHASSKLLDAATPLAGGAWVVLARVFTTPGFFSRSPALAAANVVAQVEATGAGAELRLVEDPGHLDGGVRIYDGTDDRVITSSPFAIPDTAGRWSAADFASDQPLTLATHQCEYRLEGRLGAATSASVRAASVALLEARGS